MAGEFIEVGLILAFLALFAVLFCYQLVVLFKYGKPGSFWGIWYALDTVEGRYAIRRLFRLFFAALALGVIAALVNAINSA
jgi:hypothetical protein